jgi:hypothetical protein
MKILEFQRIEKLNAYETGWNRLLFNSLDTYLFSKMSGPFWGKHFRKGKELALFTAESEGFLFSAVASTINVISSKPCDPEFVVVGDADCQAFSFDQFLRPLFLEEVIKTNE